jgi:hypothetical protein
MRLLKYIIRFIPTSTQSKNNALHTSKSEPAHIYTAHQGTKRNPTQVLSRCKALQRLNDIQYSTNIQTSWQTTSCSGTLTSTPE